MEWVIELVLLLEYPDHYRTQEVTVSGKWETLAECEKHLWENINRKYEENPNLQAIEGACDLSLGDEFDANPLLIPRKIKS